MTMPPLPASVPIHPRPSQHHDPDDTRKKAVALHDFLAQRFLERHDEAEILVTALGAGEHIVFYGPPGTAKTDLVSTALHCVRDSKFFHRNCFPTMPVTSMIGNIDPVAFEKQGEWVYKGESRMPGAHAVVLDEVGRLRGATQDALLGMVNERHFDNGNGTPEHIPLITAVGTSNTLIDDDTFAFTDRFLFHKWVSPIRDPRNRIKLMQGQFATIQAPSMDLDQLLYAICYLIPQVTVPTSIFDTINEIYTKLAAEQLYVSDRRLRKMVRALQSHAFMVRGDDTVADADLSILQYCVSPDEEDQVKVRRIVTEYAGATEKAMAEFTNALAEIEQEVANAAGASEENRGKVGSQLNFKLRKLIRMIDQAVEEARREGGNVTKLEDVKARAAQIRSDITSNILQAN